MTVVLATLRSKITVGEPAAGFRATALSRITLTDPPDATTLLSQLTTAGAGPIGLGPPVERVESHLVLTSDGVEVGHEGAFPGDIEVSSSPEGSTWNANARDYVGDERGDTETIDAWPGRIMTFGGAPPKVVDIENRVRFPSDQVQVYPLLTGGRQDDLTQPIVGHADVPVSGNDFLSGFEHVRIDYLKPAGVEKFGGEIITEILLLVGIPAEKIRIDPEAGFPLSSLIELSCVDGQEGLGVARKVAEGFGHFLAPDLGGDVVVRHMAPVHLPPVADLPLDIFELDEVQAVLTPPSQRVKRCYLVTGSRPQPPAEGDGLVTVGPIVTSETRKIFAKPIAQFKQGGDGELTDQLTTGFLPPVETVTARTERTEVFREGCLIQRITVSFAWKNPEVPRYTTNSPGSEDGKPYDYLQNGFIFTAGAVKDDSAATFAWLLPRFVPVTIKQEDFFRDEIKHKSLGSDDPVGTDQAEGWRGRETRTRVSEGKWRIDETPLKNRTFVSTPWESVNVRNGIPVRGNGTVVEGPEALFSGPNNPTFFSAYPPIASVPIFGIDALGPYSRESWSSVQFSESDAFGDPEEPDIHFTLAELKAARAISKPGTFEKPGTSESVFFADNVFLDEQIARLEVFTPTEPPNPIIADHEIRVEPARVGGWFSKTTEQDEGWDRKPPTDGETKFLWANGEMSKFATLRGRLLETRVHNFIPTGDTHDNQVTNTDGEDKLLPSTSTTGNPSHSPVAPVCMPEIDAFDSVEIEGQCCNFANTTFLDGIERISGEFVESAEQAAELACILQRRDSAPIALISLPSLASLFYSGAPVKLIAVPKGIDPALYFALNPEALSNAWVQDVRYRRNREEKTNEQDKKTVLSVRVAVL